MKQINQIQAKKNQMGLYRNNVLENRKYQKKSIVERDNNFVKKSYLQKKILEQERIFIMTALEQPIHKKIFTIVQIKNPVI